MAGAEAVPKQNGNFRLSVNINPECKEALERLSEQDGVSVTETIRRAIGCYAFFKDSINQGFATLEISDMGDGNLIAMVYRYNESQEG